MVHLLAKALLGTALAIVCSIPLALLAAGNLTPWWVHQPVRRLLDACRAINEMVFAMLFIVAVGLGPFAGVLALFVHTTGTLSKLFSEAVEAIAPANLTPAAVATSSIETASKPCSSHTSRIGRRRCSERRFPAWRIATALLNRLERTVSRDSR